MPLEEYVDGRERSYRGRKLFVVEKSLKEIESGRIGEYVRDNRECLYLKNLTRAFPDLEHIPKQKMLFFDIETCDLGPESPIISIAMAHMQHQCDMSIQCLFARDYTEERAVLQYFADIIHGYDAFFTYNGKSFDVPRIQKRMIQNGLFDSKGRKLKKIFEDQGRSHHDLYLIGQEKARILLSDARLQTIEKEGFHFRRRNDLPGEEIPRTYYEYVYGRKRMSKQVRADEQLWQECKKQAREVVEAHLKHSSGNAPRTEEEEKIWQQRETDYIIHLYEQNGGGFKDVYSPGPLIDKQQRTRDMARLIKHNLLDTVSLAAVLCFLLSPNKQFPCLFEEDELPF